MWQTLVKKCIRMYPDHAIVDGVFLYLFVKCVENEHMQMNGWVTLFWSLSLHKPEFQMKNEWRASS